MDVAGRRGAADAYSGVSSGPDQSLGGTREKSRVSSLPLLSTRDVRASMWME